MNLVRIHDLAMTDCGNSTVGFVCLWDHWSFWQNDSCHPHRRTSYIVLGSSVFFVHENRFQEYFDACRLRFALNLRACRLRFGW